MLCPHAPRLRLKIEAEQDATNRTADSLAAMDTAGKRSPLSAELSESAAAPGSPPSCLHAEHEALHQIWRHPVISLAAARAVTAM